MDVPTLAIKIEKQHKSIKTTPTIQAKIGHKVEQSE